MRAHICREYEGGGLSPRSRARGTLALDVALAKRCESYMRACDGIGCNRIEVARRG